MLGIDGYTWNVVQVSMAFLLIFASFNSEGFIEETVLDSYSDKGKMKKHSGYLGLSLIYGGNMIGNLLFAPVIINWLGSKWCMILGASTYALFIAGFLFLNYPFLIISSLIIVIWTAEGSYMALNSTKETAGKMSGLFWAVSQANLSIGGIFMYIVFKNTNRGEKHDMADETVKILYSVFLGAILVGILVLALLRVPEPASGVAQPKKDPIAMIKSMFKLLFTKQMLTMSFVFMYVGIELSFWSGVYSTCISNTDKIGDNPKAIVGLTAIAEGLGMFLSGGLYRVVLSKYQKVPRILIVFIGMVIHLCVFVLVYLNLPNESPLNETKATSVFETPSVAIVLVCGFFLGFADSCWNTQIYSFLIAEFPNQSAQAFSIYKFFHAMITCAAFFWSKYIKLEHHLIILCSTAIWGCFCFFISERFLSKDDHVVPLEYEITGKALFLTPDDEYLKRPRVSTYGDYDKY